MSFIKTNKLQEFLSFAKKIKKTPRELSKIQGCETLIIVKIHDCET